MDCFEISQKDIRKLNSACPDCGSREFVASDHPNSNRHCTKCRTKWHVCEPQMKLFVKRAGWSDMLAGDVPINCGFEHEIIAKY